MPKKQRPVVSWPNFLIPSVFTLIFLISPGSAEKQNLLPSGTIAPSFNLPDLAGNRLSLNALCGPARSTPLINKSRQIVILSFWATYCLPCAVEIPVLQRFARKHSGEPVKVLLVSIDEQGEEIVAPFVQQYRYTLPVLLDSYRKTAVRYGVKGLPSLFVIDSGGVIRFSSTGYDKKVDLEQLLDSIMQKIRLSDTAKTAAAAPIAPGTIPAAQKKNPNDTGSHVAGRKK